MQIADCSKRIFNDFMARCHSCQSADNLCQRTETAKVAYSDHNESTKALRNFHFRKHRISMVLAMWHKIKADFKLLRIDV